MRTTVWVITGLLLPLLLPGLPTVSTWLVLGLLTVITGVGKRSWKPFALLVAMCWTLAFMHSRLDQRLDPAPDTVLSLSGHISSLPEQRGDMTSFRFSPDSAGTRTAGTRGDLLVRWYRDAPALRAGEFWQLELRIKPARSVLNLAGPDREMWYFGQGISALGIVKSDGSMRLAERVPVYFHARRQQVRDSLLDVLDNHPAGPVILALALADRSQLGKEAWERFRVTGTNHLLAISGMHIGLASMLGYLLGRCAMGFFPMRLALPAGRWFPWICSLVVALSYALLSGFDTPARRAMLMLTVLVLVKTRNRSTSPWAAFCLALLVVLITNPLAPLGAGFWFSFLAVATLIAVFAPRNGTSGRFHAMLVAQAGLVPLMIPVSMAWFQQYTLLGLVSNLIAIPWISLAVVPWVLLSVLLEPVGSGIAPFLLLMGAESMAGLDWLLDWMSGAGRLLVFPSADPGWIATALAVAGMYLMLLPRGLTARYLGLVLVLPLALYKLRPADPLRLEMLDVGQGLSVIAHTPHHLLLYDTGPGDGHSWSMARSSFMPAIRQTGLHSPDRVVVSHGDLDHAGGVHEIRQWFPQAEVMTSKPQASQHQRACLAPRQWSWEGYRFEILHPGPGLPYLGNDSSCVLAIYGERPLVLLSGDIGASIEARLVDRGLSRFDVLAVPHHGSRSSSSPEFLEAVYPRLSLVSAGHRNRFGFPDSLVAGRYRSLGSTLLSTADCGGIEVRFDRNGFYRARSARRARPAVWRWPAAEHCP